MLMTLIRNPFVIRAFWAVSFVLLGSAMACPNDGDDGTSVSHDTPSGEGIDGSGAGGAGGSPPRPAESDIHPPSLPGFFIVEQSSDAGVDGGADGGIEVPVSTAPDWCGRAGNADEQVGAAINIAIDYLDRANADCLTARLTATLTETQLNDFYAYLADYTVLWFYCPLEYNVPAGGIAAFGPANTAIVGAGATPLGADDAQRLTDQYVAAFTAQMMLTPAEASGLGRYVLGTAAIEAGASSLLASCETSP
jgi:hypothetical protein